MDFESISLATRTQCHVFCLLPLRHYRQGAAKQAVPAAVLPWPPLMPWLCSMGPLFIDAWHLRHRLQNSATGTRTRVARVRAEYPNQLDYSGFWARMQPPGGHRRTLAVWPGASRGHCTHGGLSVARCLLQEPLASNRRGRSHACIAAKMDTLGIEPRASRMLSGCDTTTPCAPWGCTMVQTRGVAFVVPEGVPQLSRSLLQQAPMGTCAPHCPSRR